MHLFSAILIPSWSSLKRISPMQCDLPRIEWIPTTDVGLLIITLDFPGSAAMKRLRNSTNMLGTATTKGNTLNRRGVIQGRRTITCWLPFNRHLEVENLFSLMKWEPVAKSTSMHFVNIRRWSASSGIPLQSRSRSTLGQRQGKKTHSPLLIGA